MTDGQEPKRWSDGGARSPQEQDAAALLAGGREVTPLSPEALSRIEYGITARLAGGAVLASVTTKVAVGVLLAGGGALGVMAWVRNAEPAVTVEAPVAGGPVEADRGAGQGMPPVVVPAAPPAVVAEVAEVASALSEPHEPLPRPRRRSPGATAPGPDALAQEAQLLEQAVRAAPQNPNLALAMLDEHRRRFPGGQLVGEARRVRLGALIAARRHGDAAVLAEAMRAEASGARAQELAVVAGEQHLALRRHREALARFERAIADGATGATAERAWYGRAHCRRSLGDLVGAQRDAGEYLRRFPNGARAAELAGWFP